MADVRDLLVIQTACAFFSVTADERYRAAFLEKRRTVLYLPVLHAEKTGYIIDIDLFHFSCISLKAKGIRSAQVINPVTILSVRPYMQRISWIWKRIRYMSCLS